MGIIMMKTHVFSDVLYAFAMTIGCKMASWEENQFVVGPLEKWVFALMWIYFGILTLGAVLIGDRKHCVKM